MNFNTVILIAIVVNNIENWPCLRNRGATLRLEGGGAPLVTQYWGPQDTFSYQFFIILKILEGTRVPRHPLLRSPCEYSLEKTKAD